MYVKNNIYFRAVSSHCIERFKNSQAVLLTNVIDKEKYNFNSTAVELLNASFDQWFRWLTVVEKFFLETKRIGRPELQYIANLGDRRFETIEIIVLSHPDVFDPKFSEIWLDAHTSLHEFFTKRIINLVSEDDDPVRPETVLPDITKNLIQILNNTLFELHEIDNLLYSKEMPFLSYEDLCTDYKEQYGHCILKNRVIIYKKYFDLSEVYIKNYYEGLDIIPSYVYDELKKVNIKIVKVE
jgi:hypothetical protein